jgi:hypothetical protein
MHAEHRAESDWGSRRGRRGRIHRGVAGHRGVSGHRGEASLGRYQLALRAAQHPTGDVL